MSGKVAGAILDLGRYAGATLVVALTLAEYADDDGTEIFPKVSTLAQRAKLSERMTQYALKRLREDGVLVTVKEARRGRPAVYLIDLVRVQWLRCNPCGAIGGSIGVQTATFGVQPIAPPNKDEAPVEAPKDPPQRARAQGRGAAPPRQGEMLLPVSGPQAPPSAEETLLLAEFRRVAGYSPAWGLADLRDGLSALAADCPPTAALAAAIRGYARHLDALNQRRGPRDGKHPMTRPSNWLKRREFEGFLPAEDGGGNAHGEAAAHPSWEPWRARAVEAFGAAPFATWLAATELIEAGDAVTIVAARAFHRGWITDHFAARLRRLFGREVAVTAAAAEDGGGAARQAGSG